MAGVLSFRSSARMVFRFNRVKHERYKLAVGQCQRCFQMSSKLRHKGHWQLMSAVCLERLPLITSDLTQIEEEFGALQSVIEMESSHLSDHELRYLDDLSLAERRKQEDYEETEAEAIRKTAIDAEDEWEAEFEKYTPASRLTEDDKANNTKSSNRQLDSKLVLLVKQKLGENPQWCLPQGQRLDGESMRETAERVLSNLCGDQLEASFMGNAPCGVYTYNFPADLEAKEGTQGAKVFFFKAQLQSGQLEATGKDVADHQWLTKSELLKHVPPSYGQELKKFILDL